MEKFPPIIDDLTSPRNHMARFCPSWLPQVPLFSEFFYHFGFLSSSAISNFECHVIVLFASHRSVPRKTTKLHSIQFGHVLVTLHIEIKILIVIKDLSEPWSIVYM